MISASPYTEITLRQHPEMLKDSKDIIRIYLDGHYERKKQRTIKEMGMSYGSMCMPKLTDAILRGCKENGISTFSEENICGACSCKTLLERGWTLYHSGVAHGERRRAAPDKRKKMMMMMFVMWQAGLLCIPSSCTIAWKWNLPQALKCL